jgi:hypothetical protein
MPSELVAQKTPVSKEDLIRALYEAWAHLFGTSPKKESIWCLASQWALETGWGKSMWCFNLGNVKSVEGDGHDYCFFACNEILKTATAHAMANAAPAIAKVTQDRGDGTSIIWFYPKHAGCRFRAFNTLVDGAVDYIGLLHKRFAKSWPAVLAGDPAQFSHQLRAQGYYTADESSYTKTLNSVFHTISQLNVEYTTTLDLSDDQKTKIASLVALTMAQSLDDVTQAPFNTEEDETNGAETVA